jgi:peptidoglycan/xylan/chitin deacetylase (PgdA/CDA1 family)
MFHHFHDARRFVAAEGSLSVDDLERVLAFYEGRILCALEWCQRADAGALRPGDVCLSFDDALRCQIELALPVLERRGLTALWFVYSTALQGGVENFETFRHFRVNAFNSFDEFFYCFKEAAETSFGEVSDRLRDFDPKTYLVQWPFYSDNERTYRFLRDKVLGEARMSAVYEHAIAKTDYRRVHDDLWMTEDDVRRLVAADHVVGVHSYSHPTSMATLPVNQQRDEYERNIAHLTAIMGHRPTCVAHPANSYTNDTLGILRGLGIRQAYCTLVDDDCDDNLQMPRVDAGILARELR